MIFDKLSTYDKHKVLKNMIGPYVAVLIAQYFSLEYKYSAATICILSLESTRKASLRSSFERVLAASFGLILSATIIKIFKFNPISLVIFTAIFMPLCIRFNLMQGFFTNIVLATHFLLDENVSLIFVLDQYILLLVGVLCAIVSNLYMPSQNNEIISQLEKIDSIMKDIIFDFAKALKYRAVSLKQDELFEELKINLDDCKQLVEMEKDNKLFFKKVDISKNYSLKFSEYLTLLKIRECFNKISTNISITSELAIILKDLATLSSNNYTYNILLNKIKRSEDKFKKEIDENNLNIENKATYFLLIENIKELINIRIKNIF
ncbi:MAG: aromatic acid exporter family protein [Cetobacterium sp.]|uniref:aromatic acid exporter family protein n=1 Tax=Cetobacterium sp. TaxID=2071632 RepID=UPI0025C71493|nr:aromatic acid exporter family protein [Cetobacterium sp.]